MPTVASNCAFVAPHLRATARPCIISAASGPTLQCGGRFALVSQYCVMVVCRAIVIAARVEQAMQAADQPLPPSPPPQTQNLPCQDMALLWWFPPFSHSRCYLVCQLVNWLTYPPPPPSPAAPSVPPSPFSEPPSPPQAHMWQPTTRSLSTCTMSFIRVRSSRPLMVYFMGLKRDTYTSIWPDRLEIAASSDSLQRVSQSVCWGCYFMQEYQA